MSERRGEGFDSFESSPLTRGEYIQAITHFYRGEVNRSNVWRQRLDTTTNWAVVTTAAIITFSFSEPQQTHVLLLVCNFLILGFLFMEARRFRYYSVYRARVRMLEENFVLPILTRNLISPKSDWRELVAMDLDVPKFKMTLMESLALRIRYNYYWLYSTLLAAWIVKVWLHPVAAADLAAFYAHMAAPPFPGWFVGAIALTLFVLVTGLFIHAGRLPVTAEDEVHGYEADRTHWKL